MRTRDLKLLSKTSLVHCMDRTNPIKLVVMHGEAVKSMASNLFFEKYATKSDVELTVIMLIFGNVDTEV